MAVVVWAAEVDAWVRRVVPQHMARVEAAGMAYLFADLNVMALLPWELLPHAEKRGGRKMT
jgi:nitrate reductase gamma subunit